MRASHSGGEVLSALVVREKPMQGLHIGIRACALRAKSTYRGDSALRRARRV